MATTSTIQEPTSYQETTSLPGPEPWLKAMKSEIESSKVNKTQKLVALPTGRRAIKRNRVFKVKYKPSGQFDNYKARLVAKGFLQIAGVDYNDTCFPVIKSDLMRTLCATTGDGDYYVGFEVIRPKEAEIVFLHHTRYINEVLKRFHMMDCNLVLIQANPRAHLSM